MLKLEVKGLVKSNAYMIFPEVLNFQAKLFGFAQKFDHTQRNKLLMTGMLYAMKWALYSIESMNLDKVKNYLWNLNILIKTRICRAWAQQS